VRELDDGRVFDRISSYIFPNIMSVPPIRVTGTSRSTGISWIVPVDDAGYFQVMCSKARGERIFVPRKQTTGKTWREMTEQERRDFPNDFEAQEGQGPISLHSEEHLVTSDRGIVMQRRLLARQMKLVEEGGDPLNVTFDPAKALMKVRSGNFFKAAQAAE
jgi:hypothetical protein